MAESPIVSPPPAAPQWQASGAQPSGLLSPVAARRPDEDTVTMIIPQDVIVTRNDYSRVQFLKGIQEVPRHLADHWYLKAAGAQAYDQPKVAPPPSSTIPIPISPDPEVGSGPEGESRAANRKR